MSLPTIILNGFLSLCLLSGVAVKEHEIRTLDARADSLSVAASACSKPPKKKISPMVEPIPEIPFGKDKSAPTQLMKDSCCAKLAKVEKELKKKPKVWKPKPDTVVIVKHDTTKIKDYKVVNVGVKK